MINKFIFIGNLTKDPDIRQTKKGEQWVTFNIAVRGSKKDNSDTLFMNGRAWKHVASYLAQYAHKGDTLAGVGRILANNFQDSNGSKHYGVILDLDEVHKIKSPYATMQSGKNDNEAIFTGIGGADDTIMDDDLPW